MARKFADSDKVSSMPAASEQILEVIDRWLEDSPKNGRLPSRNTIAAGMVVLDHLRKKCPVEEAEVFSKGGELKSARSALGAILESYGVPSTYLKEVTTRQAGIVARRLFVALDWGSWFAASSDAARDALLEKGILHLAKFAHAWLARQNLKINCDRQFTPTAWIESILEQSKGRSGGKVEQHLIGAKLESRFPQDTIENNAGHAGDAQTGRPGDFSLGNTVYHVTASPGLPVIDKCGKNLAAGQRPLLLVPRSAVARATALAEERQLEKRIMIAAIEDFIGLNIVEMASGKDSEFLVVLKAIIEVYNRRLREVETDLSLQIEID